MTAVPRILVVCERFGPAGFGLSLAARRFTAALPGGWETVPLAFLPEVDPDPPSRLERVHPDLLDRLLKRVAGFDGLVERFRPDLIHIHGIWTSAPMQAEAWRRRGVRLVISPHGMAEPWIRHRNPIRKRLFDALLGHAAAIAAADAVHALNRAEEEAVRAWLPGVRRVVVIPNGVDAPTRAPLPSNSRDFLFCGRFHPKKNLELLLAAWREAALDGCRLLLAGDGDDGYAATIRAQAATVPGVVLLGAVGGASKEAAFASSSFGILTSHSEGQPLALLESLAAGRPVIATSGCRLPEVLELGLGWQGDDRAAIVAALRGAAALDHHERERLGEHCGGVAADRWSWTRSAGAMADLYRDLLGAPLT